MGLVRFMTVYDDETDEILESDRCKILNLSAPAPFYRTQDRACLDNFNVNSHDIVKLINSEAQYTQPTVPHNVFQYGLEKQRDAGYLASFIFCHHGKWMPYYKEAVHAIKNLNRTAKRNDENYFTINVINSKAFAIGTVLLANRLAVDFFYDRDSTPVILESAEYYAKTSKTYIITANPTIFGNYYDIRAYRVTDTRVFPIDLGSEIEGFQFDRFADIVSKAISKAGGIYATSYGCECSFFKNVIGRIERASGKIPFVTAKYGVATAHILGGNSMCIHLGEYIF